MNDRDGATGARRRAPPRERLPRARSPARRYEPVVPAGRERPRGHPALRRAGRPLGRRLLGGRHLHRAQARARGSSRPSRSRSWPSASRSFAVRFLRPARLDAARERQRPRDRRHLRHRRRRLGLHHAGHLHPRARGPLVLLPDLPRAAPRAPCSASSSSPPSAATSCATSTASSPTPRPGRPPRSSSPGKRGGRSALVLTWSALVAAVFDFVGPSMKGWAENFSTAAIAALAGFTERTKAVFTMNTSAAVFGLGYIMGLDYAAIIMAGSMVSFFVLVPLFAWFGPYVAGGDPAGHRSPSRRSPAEEIFFLYVRPIGIGGIFAAGLLSILKMSPVIVQATRQALGEVARLVRGQRRGAPRATAPTAGCRCRPSSSASPPPGSRSSSTSASRSSPASPRATSLAAGLDRPHPRDRLPVRRRVRLGHRDDLDHPDLGDDPHHPDRDRGRPLRPRPPRRERHAPGPPDRRRRVHGALDVRLPRHAVQDRATGSARRRAGSRSRTSPGAVARLRSPPPPSSC